MASYVSHGSNKADQNTQVVEADPGQECLPAPVSVESVPGAIEQYADLLESSAVATFFSVMSSTKASAMERLEAATRALKAVGKENPAATAAPIAPQLTLNLIAPVQSAFRGIADIVDVLDRTKRVGPNDGV